MPPARGKGQITFDQEEAVAKMQELYEVVVDMFPASSTGVTSRLNPKPG